MQFPGFVNGGTALSITMEIVQHNYYLFMPCLTQNSCVWVNFWYDESLEKVRRNKNNS